MEMQETAYFDGKLSQLHTDLKMIAKQLQDLSERFARFEEQKIFNSQQLAELQIARKEDSHRIDELEQQLSYYKGAVAVAYILIAPIFASVIGLIIHAIMKN